MSELGYDDPYEVLHWYDFVCPFCYVGQSRTALLVAAGLDVISLPFQAHPDIPAGGLPAGPRGRPMYRILEQEAAAAGLTLQWPARIPNSRRALAVAEWVRRNQPNAFTEVHRGLFEAHFTLGEDIDDQAVIDRHARNAGIDPCALHTAIADGCAYAGVSQAERAGRWHGVEGTPAWLLDGRLVTGLQPVSEFQRVARNVLGQRGRSERTKL
ncbi:MAG TPA: DsbA family protein [Mycobacterium sp.]|jgi:predicted DsbA family dithiol-disulfide isomerase|nr:DsbA family protein [Mycobacterium sp.]